VTVSHLLQSSQHRPLDQLQLIPPVAEPRLGALEAQARQARERPLERLDRVRPLHRPARAVLLVQPAELVQSDRLVRLVREASCDREEDVRRLARIAGAKEAVAEREVPLGALGALLDGEAAAGGQENIRTRTWTRSAQGGEEEEATHCHERASSTSTSSS